MPDNTVDTLIDARWIIPVEPARQTLSRHSIAIADGVIRDILPTEEAHVKYSARQHFRLDDHVLIPGLINLHTHAAMSLLRGLADDLPLMDWLNNHIWPAEAKFVSPEFVRDGTLLACAEMLRGGITCFNDMYFFPEAAAQTVLSTGMRAAIGIIVVDFPTAYAADADDYLSKGLAVRDEFHGEPLLTFTLAPHAPYTVSDKTFAKVLTYAEQLDLPIHIHLHETHDEIEASLKQYQMRPIERLHRLGLLGPNLIAVHAVQLNTDEIRLLAEHGCHVAHCPSSNLKLASGISPVVEKLEQEINVGLGTDGAASNNRLDMFAEMRLAALLAKGQSGHAAALPAHQALAMATINAAKALGIDHLTGSLAIGKAADITAVDLSAPETQPCYDVTSHLVYTAGRENVSHVWVNGKLVLDERHLTTIDIHELNARTSFWHEKISNQKSFSEGQP
ncbi:N-ethylammeline chlorohydrolase [Sulfuricella sp. T08]|uniref:TRZ/ATZ family hydrolase n=1 Tax=Sulfuricella sp. T08 TaxID=1632857 RepID=UPI0006179C7A|nr:TRZ/ATZ family hydrolase [Sulfuricella sp. T08]GAO36054.1 N-ethylammeline chlorohydrolase [Sulfuricella sp. T08]